MHTATHMLQLYLTTYVANALTLQLSMTVEIYCDYWDS